MAERKDVTFSMAASDLMFLAYAMEFIKGGIDDGDETVRGFWELTFRRALEDQFDLEQIPEEERASAEAKR